MSDELKPATRPWSVPALIASVVLATPLGFSAGSKVDDLLNPSIGPTAATVAGFTTVFVALILVSVLSYRGLTR